MSDPVNERDEDPPPVTVPVRERASMIREVGVLGVAIVIAYELPSTLREIESPTVRAIVMAAVVLAFSVASYLAPPKGK